MRVFKCPSCGHRMRFVGERCGRCFAEKPLLKAGRLYIMLLYLVMTVGSFTLLGLALVRFMD